MSNPMPTQLFGTKLRSLRMQQGLTLQQLAHKLGLTAHGYISELEAGKKAPTLDFVLGVARLFKLSTDQLLKDELELPEHSIAQTQPDSLAFIERPPTADEIERLRLMLSTFQDGSGMVKAGPSTLPGWRDFERVVSTVLLGEAPENKAVFDVLLQDRAKPQLRYGLSCKMRSELHRVTRPQRDGRVTIEESNSAGEFKAAIRAQGITDAEYHLRAQEIGLTLLEVIKQRKERASIYNNGTVDIEHSYYLVLLWSRRGSYQLFQFSLHMPQADTLHWYYPHPESRHLNGDDADANRIFEWYPDSGGQLKYYPHATEAVWQSDIFHLEPLNHVKGYGLAEKAATYFPEAWYKGKELGDRS
ncbi:helix-turn-helix domain-containing protein [Candidatus Chloroploca sp. Khr17]|uniref:helix-turn-helix domain-containing protein n=1 Tax=Candidatus Chloroploca sp. Khr17 TaxID=2496869 RepID=UPI00101C0C2E|nr:helix-turn-helix transcriptional regulator [Candidatus Chloroploca sp. Khr17]